MFSGISFDEAALTAADSKVPDDMKKKANNEGRSVNRMKALIHTIVFVIAMVSATAWAGDTPQRVSVAPKNDLSAIVYSGPRGAGFGSSVCGYNLSKEFEEGYRIGSRNDHFGTRNKLVIDDGKSTFPATDKDTGLPVVILTDSKITKELQDLVRGYNAAMQRALEQRKKQTGQASGGNGGQRR